MKRTMPQVR